MLTGNKDLDIIVLNNLEDRDLVNYCQTNKKAEILCNDQSFWLNRIMLKFPYLGLEILNKYKQELWSEYYIKDLRNIARSANMNQTLIKASQEGRLDHVMIAIANGADIHVWNDSAVMLASMKGHLDTVRYLVSVGAYIHIYDDLLVKLASRNGHADVVDYLVSMGSPDPR